MLPPALAMASLSLSLISYSPFPIAYLDTALFDIRCSAVISSVLQAMTLLSILEVTLPAPPLVLLSSFIVSSTPLPSN
jgi:hypothetical protein